MCLTTLTCIVNACGFLKSHIKKVKDLFGFRSALKMQSEHLFTSWGGDLKWLRESGVTGVPQRFMGNKVCSAVFLGQSDCRNHSNYFMYVRLSATTFCPFKGAACQAGAWQIKRVLFQMWWLLWSFLRRSHCSEMCLKARKWEVRVTVRKRVDVLMSRSKHTIPHAQSSPRVNLSIGAKQGRYRTGQEGVEPKTRNRKTERKIKALKLQPERLFQKTVSSPHSLPLNALTLIWDTEHLHLEKSKAEGGWICASATWSLDLPQICSQSVALTRLRDWSKFSNFFFLYVLDAGWRFMEVTHIRQRWCWEQMHHFHKETLVTEPDLAEIAWHM